jgi:hypothetical protein
MNSPFVEKEPIVELVLFLIKFTLLELLDEMLVTYIAFNQITKQKSNNKIT